MAIFGSLDILKKQTTDDKFKVVFEYLAKVLDETSEENKRLNAYDLDVFEKIELDTNNFALEQTYNSKDREKCFFESHKQYIDVQFILEGEEIIEVDNIKNLNVYFEYDKNIDLIKYDDSNFASSIKLKKGDIAIFFPDDAHMPCIKINEPIKVIKTVVKVKV
ncbi:MAG: YhcH/YjgK/YiaL family protein [Campylobacterota bacterium]|nr:YhcH/YjgK/YiaL family protein [Campylobacterota bacterium]